MSNMTLINAYQLQVADLQRGLKQSSELVAKMMGERFSDEDRRALFDLVTQHIKENENSRSANLTGMLRTTLLALNRVAQATADQRVKQELIEIIKALNIVDGAQ